MHQIFHQGDPKGYEDSSGRLRIYGKNMVWNQKCQQPKEEHWLEFSRLSGRWIMLNWGTQ